MLMKVGLFCVGLLLAIAGSCSGGVPEYSAEQIYGFITQVQDSLRENPHGGSCRLPELARVDPEVKRAVLELTLEDVLAWDRGPEKDSILITTQEGNRKYLISVRIRDNNCYQFEMGELLI